MFTERFFGKPKLWKPLFLRMNYKLQKSSFSHSISSNIDYQIRPFHIENVGMSNSTCRHPVTGWNNGSHNINSQPDSAIKWKKTLPKAVMKTSSLHLTRRVFLTQRAFLYICSHTKDRTGKLCGVKSPDRFIGTEHLSSRPQSLLTTAALCLPSINALMMPTKAGRALWLVPHLSLARFHSFSMEAL